MLRKQKDTLQRKQAHFTGLFQAGIEKESRTCKKLSEITNLGVYSQCKSLDTTKFRLLFPANSYE